MRTVGVRATSIPLYFPSILEARAFEKPGRQIHRREGAAV
jgi:hypothetical protein